jgi:hypothetical protein
MLAADAHRVIGKRRRRVRAGAVELAELDRVALRRHQQPETRQHGVEHLQHWAKIAMLVGDGAGARIAEQADALSGTLRDRPRRAAVERHLEAKVDELGGGNVNAAHELGLARLDRATLVETETPLGNRCQESVQNIKHKELRTPPASLAQHSVERALWRNGRNTLDIIITKQIDIDSGV